MNTTIDRTKDNLLMGEADDICDLVERGSFDYSRPHEEVVADLVKVAQLAMMLRDDIMAQEQAKWEKSRKWWPW